MDRVVAKIRSRVSLHVYQLGWETGLVEDASEKTFRCWRGDCLLEPRQNTIYLNQRL